MNVIESFDVTYAGKPKALVLGSIPGVASLEAVQYYAHPRNGFWPIMTSYFGIDPELTYEQRLSLLTGKGVALWDVLQQCERKGSLDSAIVKGTIQVNPIEQWLQSVGGVSLIILNGGKAAKEFNKHVLPKLNTDNLVVAEMPSTSPAYAAMKFEEKRKRWHCALNKTFG
jgi:hypoxanthine-DNA glycosylase